MGRPSAGKKFPHSELGARIREAREAAGLTQTETSRALGFQFPSGYQKIESGQHSPSIEVIRRCAALFRRSVGDLIGESTQAADLVANWGQDWADLLLRVWPDQRQALLRIGQAIVAQKVRFPALAAEEAERYVRALSVLLPPPPAEAPPSPARAPERPTTPGRATERRGTEAREK